MDSLEHYLDIQIEILKSKLRALELYKKSITAPPDIGTSKIKIVENILRSTGKPMHVSEIIAIAERDHQVKLNRDSIVSNMLKKVNSGQNFIKTGPNTFALKRED